MLRAVPPEPTPPTGLSHPGIFATTHWNMVRAAGAQSSEALETLCRGYWYPLFAFVRRQGHDIQAAQDLTQEFFARLLQGNSLAQADPARGRFRSFLLASLKHFLTNEWHRSQCQKRGGGCQIFSTDEASAEERRYPEPADHTSPDKLYERRWAETLLARVNQRLRREYEAAGWGERFELLKVYLLNDYDPVSYAEMAARLGLTPSAVKSAIYKLRQRYGQMFRAEVAQTVGPPGELDEEIQFLLQALSD